MELKIFNESGYELPQYATEMSAGLDLRAVLPAGVENIVLFPMERKIIKTGLYIALPKGYEAQIRPRSGISIKKGLTVINAPGTIDADYRGEIGVPIINLSDKHQIIEAGERIAQMVIAKHERVESFEEVIDVTSLGETSRGGGGFGSTGNK